MPKPEDKRWIISFIAALRRLVGDKRDSGTLAKLRQGLTGHASGRDIWVYQHLRGAAPQHEEFAALVASLFALWHQGERGFTAKPPPSLGASFKELADAERRQSGLKPRDSVPNVERRFAVLLDSHTDDLPIRLRHAVNLLRSKDIPVNWNQLLIDLLGWDRQKRPVQRTWARDFWVSGTSDESTDADDRAETVTAETTTNSASEENTNDS